MIFFRFCFTVMALRTMRLLFVLLAAVLWAGGVLSGEAATAEAAAEAAPAPEADDYILQSSDIIRVIVFQEPDLEREVRISQEGSVALPLIEMVSLKGKTVREAEELIRELYDRDYLVNPQITVSVLEYSKRTVSVTGAVAKQGAVSFPPEKQMTLVEAISEAGPTRLADLRKVKLTRRLPDGSTQTSIINVDNLLKGEASEEWLLRKDDVIFVPERLL